MEAKICLVTGATSGIGLETAAALAAEGAEVTGVGRDPERSAAARAEILRRTPDARICFETADLASQSDIRALAGRLRGRLARLDVLVNNAGTFRSRYEESPDGIEMQFAVNHLAGFLLTRELFPLLRASAGARIIGVSSGSHFSGRMRWDDVGMRKNYFGLSAYDQSKLAVALFTAEIARRFGMDAYAVDPGLVKTEIGRKKTGPLVKLVWGLRARGGIEPAESARSIAWLALAPEAAGRTGLYWKNRAPAPSSPAARSLADAERLWKLSEELCGAAFP